MKLMYGDVWTAWERASLFWITTNGVIKPDGRLVMGAGIAKQALERFPDLDLVLGRAIQEYVSAWATEGDPHGVLTAPNNLLGGHLYPSTHWPQAARKLATFQTKYHWRGKASLPLIELCARQICAIAEMYPDREFHGNYPGVGHGGLDEADVYEVIKGLPDNVYVWQYSKS